MAASFVGVGFVAVLTGAIAERFLVRPPRDTTSALTHTDRDALAKEIREMSERLRELEAGERFSGGKGSE